MTTTRPACKDACCGKRLDDAEVVACLCVNGLVGYDKRVGADKDSAAFARRRGTGEWDGLGSELGEEGYVEGRVGDRDDGSSLVHSTRTALVP